MESRQRTAEKELVELLELLVAGVRVFQAGGQEALTATTWLTASTARPSSSAIRLYSQFDAADHEHVEQGAGRSAQGQPRSP
jgi:hypothetical protein